MGHLLDFLAGLGVNGINPDPETDPAVIRSKLPRAIIYGCVPPLLLKDGTPELVMAEARRSIELAGEGGGLVLTAAGSINMGTPYANLRALAEAAGALRPDVIKAGMAQLNIRSCFSAAPA